MRTPWPATAGGVLVALIGAAGLIRGAQPEHAAATSSDSGAQPLVVSGAYVRAPVPPVDVAAAYFTVTNNTGTADRLLRVVTGAGASAVLHIENPDGSMSANPSAVIPAHGSLKLSVGKGHVMIEHVYGTLKAGQSVNLELDFADAGSIDVAAPVVAVGAPVPAGGHS